MITHLASFQPLGTIVFTITAGVFALILAEKIRLPSILFLLLFGTLLGPECANLIQPQIFRDNFPALISIMVAMILFEGGASLKYSQFQAISSVVRNLLSWGVLTTLIAFSLGAHYFIHLEWMRAILLGSIMVVTGPTVVIPILHRIRVKENLHNILRWEAILVDSLGVIIAVVLFEFMTSESVGVMEGLGLFLGRLIVGMILGLLSGFIMLLGFRKKWFLQHEGEELGGLFVLAVNLLFFGLAEWILPESGLVTVTVAGIFIGNQKFPFQEQVFNFKKQVTLFALSVLFILLASNIPLRDTFSVLPEGIALLVFAILIVRPLAVFISTVRDKLNFREKLFLSFLAPRGIVSASLASLFALELEERALIGHGRFLPLAFFVIAGSIVVYAALAGILVRVLRVQEEKGTGVVIVGANSMGLIFGKALRSCGITAKFIDSNSYHCGSVRLSGFDAYCGSAFDSDFLETLDLKGIAYMVALTPNHEVNVLSAQTFSGYLGRRSVFRLWDKSDDWGTVTSAHYDASKGVPVLIQPPWIDEALDSLIAKGTAVESVIASKSLKWSREDLSNFGIQRPLFARTKTGQLIFPAPGVNLTEGSELYYLTAKASV